MARALVKLGSLVKRVAICWTRSFWVEEEELDDEGDRIWGWDLVKWSKDIEGINDDDDGDLIEEEGDDVTLEESSFVFEPKLIGPINWYSIPELGFGWLCCPSYVATK